MMFYRHLDQDTNFLLKFKLKESEDDYASYREPYSSLPLIAALIVQSVDIFYSFLILPRYVKSDNYTERILSYIFFIKSG